VPDSYTLCTLLLSVLLVRSCLLFHTHKPRSVLTPHLLAPLLV
jgi:hypothetical protein